jgi:hypothetical protein
MVDELDWKDADFQVTTHDVFTPNKGPENGFHHYIWRVNWPPSNDSITWNYFLNPGSSPVVGLVQDDPNIAAIQTGN